MITISTLSGNLNGTMWYRIYQPLFSLCTKYPKEFRFISSDLDNLVKSISESDIFFTTSISNKLDEILDICRNRLNNEGKMGIKYIGDYDDAPLKYIYPGHPNYKDYGTKEVDYELGSFWNTNNKQVTHGYKWIDKGEIDNGIFDIEDNKIKLIEDKLIRNKLDYISTTTETLKNEIIKEVDNKNKVEVLPNFIDMNKFDNVNNIYDRTKGIDEIRIGWIFGKSHLPDFYQMLPTIIDILKEKGNDNVKFFIMSDYTDLLITMIKDIGIDPNRFIIFPYIPVNKGYYNIIKAMQLDICLCHLRFNQGWCDGSDIGITEEYNKYKSPIKFIESTAIGAAVIAPQPLYEDYIVHDSTGLLYRNHKEFRDGMNKLINDKELRIKLNNNAMDIVNENYTVDKVLPKYKKYFERIVNEK